MNWVQRKIYLYNVTIGLYMLDLWERILFNVLLAFLIWFVGHTGAKFAMEIYQKGMLAR